jgi:hypothetical protein
MASNIVTNDKGTKNPKIKKYALLGLIFIAIAIFAFFVQRYLFSNRALEVADPIQTALMKKGARKICENGDGGRGPDNQTPWSQVFYDLPVDKHEAQAAVYQIADQNGFKLTHASPKNRGFLGAVADVFIDKWYFSTNKTVPYNDMEPGQIQLAFAVDGPGSTYECGGKLQQGHSVVGVDVRLTSFKR